jgi:hypothetical protein
MTQQARQDGDRGTLFRAATWLFASTAGAMNYWHALDGNQITHPTPKAVSFGVMSLVGIGLWELYSSLIHRKELRRRGALPPARPRFGVARWVRYPGRAWDAWSVSIRDGLTTVEEAWTVAGVERQAKRAKKAANPNAIPVRQEPAVPAPETSANNAVLADRPGDNTPPPVSASDDASPEPGSGDNTTASTPAMKRRRRSRSGGRKPRRSMTEWVDLAAPIFHAEFDRLQRQPTGAEFAEAIKKAGLGAPSASTAKNIRTEILDRAPLPSLD